MALLVGRLIKLQSTVNQKTQSFDVIMCKSLLAFWFVPGFISGPITHHILPHSLTAPKNWVPSTRVFTNHLVLAGLELYRIIRKKPNQPNQKQQKTQTRQTCSVILPKRWWCQPVSFLHNFICEHFCSCKTEWIVFWIAYGPFIFYKASISFLGLISDYSGFALSCINPSTVLVSQIPILPHLHWNGAFLEKYFTLWNIKQM